MSEYLPSVCGCLGPQFNEPYCPCMMQRTNTPPSPERLEYLASIDSKSEEEKWRNFIKELEMYRD